MGKIVFLNNQLQEKQRTDSLMGSFLIVLLKQSYWAMAGPQTKWYLVSIFFFLFFFNFLDNLDPVKWNISGIIPFIKQNWHSNFWFLEHDCPMVHFFREIRYRI